ncbi:TnsD family Tn7-like transposition protein [Cupriavidus taiwanensis]|uniref:TnsD family Tn7-like transposition protein n=1 Tax=Cupriavidus taiwanensis TaxID=164546 RepID=UPI000E2F97CA|nr:TnsD family Tn7-like transposition protein [Cupriavidus taiwanensis]
MMEQMVTCVPRDPFEAASSLANSLLGAPPLQRRAGRWCSMDVAFGTVSWPLNLLAAVTESFFGTGVQLMRERSLVDYCRFQLAAQGRSQLESRVLDGTGVMRQPPWAPWMVDTLRPRMACPICARENWEQFGVFAWLWPHQAPFVSACWRHGIRLVRASDVAGSFCRTRMQSASQDELAFARDSISICQLGQELLTTALWLNEAMAVAGFRHPNGEFCDKQFCAFLREYCSRHMTSLALSKSFASPRFGRRVLAWIAGRVATISPVVVVVTLGCLREAGTTAMPAYSRRKPHQHQSRGWPGRYRCIDLFIDGRRHFSRKDIEKLLRQGCSCRQVAGLCHVSASTVWRYVEQRNLWGTVRRLQENRCRLEARSAWRGVRSRFPNASRNQLREREPRAYRWLMAHDKRWLLSQPAAYEPLNGWRRGVLKTPGSHSKILARLRSAIRTIEQNGRITRSALCRELGVSAYMLQRWRTASGSVARLLDSTFARPRRDKHSA